MSYDPRGARGDGRAGDRKQANNCLFSTSEQKRGTQCIFPTVFAFYSLFADRSVTIFFTDFEPSAWVTIKTRLKQGKKTVSSRATCSGTEGYTCGNGNQNNKRWKLEWFVYKVTNKNNKKESTLCMCERVFDTTRVISGQNGRNGGTQTHTYTQRLGSLALVGRACTRNANSHRHPPGFEANSPVCCANTSRAARGCEQTVALRGPQASTPKSSWLTVNLSDSDVWHISPSV